MPPLTTDSVLTHQHVLERLGLRLPQLHHLIRVDQPLLGLALDSIDMVELLCVIESEFDVSVSDDDVAAAVTVGDLAELICRRSNERSVRS